MSDFTADQPPSAAWQAFAEADGNALAWLDATGRLRWCNAAFEAADITVRQQALAQAVAGTRSTELTSQDGSGQARGWRMRVLHLPDDGLALVLREVHDGVERLTAENARLRELLDMAQEFGRLGVWERDPHTLQGRWDRHVFRFFGIEATDGATPHYAEAAARIDPADRLDETFRASLSRPGAYASRYRVRHPDGSVRQIHSQWRVVADARGEPERVIGVMVDDTEAHELARDAEATHAQLELALSLANIGTWRYELGSDRILYDAHAQQVLGRSTGAHGVPIETVRSWIHPDDLPQVQAAFDEAVASGRPTDTRTRYLHADGTWRMVLTRRVLQRDAHGRPVAVHGVGMDLTEQHQRDQLALQLAQRLEAAAEAAHIGLWSGALDGRPAEWNALMYGLVGLDPARGPMSMGELLRHRVHVDDRDRLAAQAFDWVRNPDRAPLRSDFRVVWPDGSTHWLQLRASMETGGGAVPRAFGVLIDVTDQRETLLRLSEAHERATLAMGSVGMGTWHHDIATGDDDWDAQMFALRGLPPQPKALDADSRLALVHPDDRAHVAASSVPQLASAQPLAYEFRVIRPDGSVRWLASRSTPLFDERGQVVRRIGVNWDITEAKMAERAERERELALRESQAKSQFLARMSHKLRTPLNAVLGFTQLLLAEDDGGDASARRHKLERVHAAGQQLLALVDDALELSGIQPGAAGPAVLRDTAANEVRQPDTSPGVLYIEDNPVNMLLVRELVRQRPHLEFHGAVDGASGIALARTLQPLLVLIDMQLPDGDGLAVLRQLRADPATRHLTCVALSANAIAEDVQRARDAGFADYWTKPIDLAKFLIELDRLVPGASAGTA